MLYYLKLTNPVTKVYQDGFDQITVSGSYLTAQPMGYELGAPTASFYVKLGKMEFDESGSATSFKRLIYSHLPLTQDELSSWGTDDFEALKAVAAKLNFEVESSGSAPNLNSTF